VEGGFEELSFPVNTIPLLGKVIGEKLFYELKDKKPEIIIILDPDALKDAIRLYEQLQSIYFDCGEKVKIVVMEGKYDLDEVKRNFDVEGVKQVVKTARYLNDLDYLRLK
jgi:5S rRNA maturation endonuclease (ribonuclease M5)